MIRPTLASDSAALMSIVEDSAQFDADGLAHVAATLEGWLAGDSDAIWLTALDGDVPVGVAYCTPEPVTQGTWNLLMLWTHRDHHGRGHGSSLVRHIEAMLVERAARLLIVETSGTDAFIPARGFYERCGFVREACIRDFYDAGDDKVVYTRPVNAAAR